MTGNVNLKRLVPALLIGGIVLLIFVLNWFITRNTETDARRALAHEWQMEVAHTICGDAKIPLDINLEAKREVCNQTTFNWAKNQCRTEFNAWVTLKVSEDNSEYRNCLITAAEELRKRPKQEP